MSPKNKAINLDDIGDDVNELEGTGDLLDQEIDFEKVKGFTVVAAGEYRLRVEAAQPALSKSSNKPMGKFRLLILEGEHEGVQVFQDLSFSMDENGRGGMARSKPILVGMGMPETARLSPRGICQAVKGLEFWGVLDVEQSDGINDKTGRAYDPRNKLVSASQTPQLSA